MLQFFKKDESENFLRIKEKNNGLSKKYLNGYKALFNHIKVSGILNLKDHKTFTLENCIEFMGQNNKWSASTYNFYAKLLMVFVKFLSIKYGTENFAKRFPYKKEMKKLPKFYNNEDLKKIFSILNENEKKVVLFFLYTGVRKKEFLSIQSHDIKEKYIYIRNSKGGRDRVIPIAENLKIFIGDLNFPFSERFYNSLLNKIQENFKGFKFHNLRHTFAFKLKNSGVDIYDTSQLLGHKHITSTVAYNGLDVLNKKNLVNLLNFDY